MSDAREERLARNEASFRALNEAIETEVHARLSGTNPARLSSTKSRLAGYVCECGHADCVEVVRMTIAQYEEVRRDSRLFLVSPGHELPEIEDVTYRETGFVVVRKHDDVADIVQETDPRS